MARAHWKKKSSNSGISTLTPVFNQLLFVLLLYIGSRFRKGMLNIVTILCLLWTATHLFFVPLAVLQTLVILGSHMFFRRRMKAPK